MGKNKLDRIQFRRATDGQGRRGRIFAASCIKRTETVLNDDLIVENESESVGEKDVEEIESEKAHEEKN